MTILLAPMEGLLDHPLRQVLTAVGGIDRCVTEFIRITDQLLPERVFTRVMPELLRGRTAGGDPTAVTAGNFLRATPLALGVSTVMAAQMRWDGPGVLLALASGALASGMGYAIWYTALRGLTATRAAILQLSVPALATAGGVALLGEPLTPHLLGASLAVLGGVLVVTLARAPAPTAPRPPLPGR